MKKQKVYEVLAWASSFLVKHHREENVAKVLMEHHLDVSASVLHMMMQEHMPESIYEAYQSDVKTHALTGVPVQHLTGYAYFYGRKFFVNEDVLIPRFETEELVFQVIEQIKKLDSKNPITIVDVGTGSGAIAISLALELPNIIVYATDISKKALYVAERNAQQLGANVIFKCGDFLQPIIDANIHPQVVVSNPPYIDLDVEQSLADTVRNYDPHLALFADNHGLAAYETIVTQSTCIPYLSRIDFEIGYDQAEAVKRIVLQTYPHSDVQKYSDINGKDRIISVKFP